MLRVSNMISKNKLITVDDLKELNYYVNNDPSDCDVLLIKDGYDFKLLNIDCGNILIYSSPEKIVEFLNINNYKQVEAFISY